MTAPGETAAPYTHALASIYDRLPDAGFTASLLPQLIPYMQGNLDWYGRQILDLGCGTGGAARWLAQHTMNVTAVDQSADMLRAGQRGFDSTGLGLTWLQGDVRSLRGLAEFDLALAFDLLNEMGSLRDLESVLAAIRAALTPGKLFVFDLHTAGGLARAEGTRVVLNAPDVFVTSEAVYDHERQVLTTAYEVFLTAGQGANAAWGRRSGTRIQRGYAVQAIAALLTRAGYQLLAVLTPDLAPVDTAALTPSRVLFCARTRVTA